MYDNKNVIVNFWIRHGVNKPNQTKLKSKVEQQYYYLKLLLLTSFAVYWLTSGWFNYYLQYLL